mgnify:FL=1
MSWSHLNLFVGSVLFYDITIYFLYIAFGFFLIPMEHNFMERKKKKLIFNYYYVQCGPLGLKFRLFTYIALPKRPFLAIKKIST